MTEIMANKDMTPQENGTREEAGPEAGFTLLELLIVITILTVLAAAVGTVAINQLGRAKTDTAKLQIDQLTGALDLFRLDFGRYPSDQEGLAALIEAPSNAEQWRGPYLRKAETLKDPWGRPFLYRSPGQHGEIDIYSLGADNAEGGDGENVDVQNW